MKYVQWKRLKTEGNLDTPQRVEEKRDMHLNFEFLVMDFLLSNLKSPVTDGIIDISDSSDWQASITSWFFRYSISESFKALHQLRVLGRGEGVDLN